MMTIRNIMRPLGIGFIIASFSLTACTSSYQAKIIESAPERSVSVAPSSRGNDFSPPSCQASCEMLSKQGVVTYAEKLHTQGKVKEAVDFLQTCTTHCPAITCLLEKLYSVHSGLFSAKEYSSKVLELGNRCLESPPANFSANDQLSVTSDQDLARQIQHTQVRIEWGSTLRKTGYALIGVGSAFLLTAILLTIVDRTYYGIGKFHGIPVPGDCGYLTGVRGDSCAIDGEDLYVPGFIVGASLLGTGIGLAVHYSW